jgi:hypothetical protein
LSEPIWEERNNFLVSFNITDKNILDLGCGDKSIVNYIHPKKYLGLDKSQFADIQIDFDKQSIEINEKFDVALILGVLEYLETPEKLLTDYNNNADRFIILILERKIKPWHGWKNAFTEDSVQKLAGKFFTTIKPHRYKNYVILDCNK